MPRIVQSIQGWDRITGRTPEQNLQSQCFSKGASGFTGDGKSIDPHVGTDAFMRDNRFRFKVND